MKIFSGVNAYIPRSAYLPGVVVVTVASLICMWFMAELPKFTNGQTYGLSSLTLAILVGIH